MKHKQRFLRILGFVLMLVVFGALLSQPSAPEENLLLVPYLLTWHAKAHGSKYEQSGGGEMTSWRGRYFAEISGSAIVRFQFVESAKRFWHYDTRVLSLVVSDNYDRWENSYRDPATTSSPAGECSTHWSLDIPAKSGSANSGLYIPPKGIDWGVENPLEKRADGVTVMHDPFRRLLGLQNLRFDEHSHLSATQWTVPHLASLRVGESPWCSDPPEVDHTNEQAPDASDLIFGRLYDLADPKFDLQAVSPNDESSFALNTRFSVVDTLRGGPQMTIDVEWTAEAHRLGKCPCALNSLNPLASGFTLAASPPGFPAYINHDDQGLVSGQTKEVVRVDSRPDDEINANGSSGSGVAPLTGASVTVWVSTCDGIPVKDEQVEITVDPIKSSGGHNHFPHRPGGKLNDQEIDKPQPTDPGTFLPGKFITRPTDEHGYVYTETQYGGLTNVGEDVYFKPPSAGTDTGSLNGAYEIGVAGVYQITARSKQFPDSKASASVTARVKGLTDIQQDPNYNSSGATTEHPDGFYATAGTANAVKKLGAEFLQKQRDHNDQLHKCNKSTWDIYFANINDFALPTGGIFDWKNLDWKPSHQTHNKGEGGDFNRFTPARAPDLFHKVGGADVENEVTDVDETCTTKTRSQRSWLLHLLLQLGKKYGHWDCSDLGLDSTGCNALKQPQGQIPDSLFPWTDDQTLHLHVED